LLTGKCSDAAAGVNTRAWGGVRATSMPVLFRSHRRAGIQRHIAQAKRAGQDEPARIGIGTSRNIWIGEGRSVYVYVDVDVDVGAYASAPGPPITHFF
jgi:hypothetical protein